jgi:hypothetical protein
MSSSPTATPVSAPGTGPAGSETGEVTRLLKAAAYFPIFNIHNPAIPNDTVPLLPIATSTLGQALFTAVNVNEALHRFEVVTTVGPRGLTTHNGLSTEPVANVTIRWTPIPEGYSPSPGVSPPPTLLNPFASQRFTMLNGQLSFQDRRVSGMAAFGSGHTYPIGGGSLNIGAVIDVLGGFGALYGLSNETLPGATMVINGFITPPQDLGLCLIVRVMDPNGELTARAPVPPLVCQQPTPTGSGVFLFFLGEPDPLRPTAFYGPRHAPTRALVYENLRLVRIGFDKDSLQSSTEEGAIVGNAASNLSCSFANELTVTPAFSTGGVFNIYDRQGRSLGSVYADMEEGRAFRTALPGAPRPVFRLGGFGRIGHHTRGTGIFAGTRGMMSMNGVISIHPPSLSNLYVLRFEDPDGQLQAQLQGAGISGAG